MLLNLSEPYCHYGPIPGGILMGLFIIFICILYRIIHNRFRFFNTKRGIKRIQESIETAADSNQSIQLKGIKFAKAETNAPVKAILNTFRDMETLKTKDSFIKLWELRIKHLENQVNRTFFKRSPFLVYCVFSLFLGIMGFLEGMRVAFLGYSMAGSGGILAISGGISESLMFPFFALLNCTLSLLGFWAAENSRKWVLTGITRMEIHLLGTGP